MPVTRRGVTIELRNTIPLIFVIISSMQMKPMISTEYSMGSPKLCEITFPEPAIIIQNMQNTNTMTAVFTIHPSLQPNIGIINSS